MSSTEKATRCIPISLGRVGSVSIASGWRYSKSSRRPLPSGVWSIAMLAWLPSRPTAVSVHSPLTVARPRTVSPRSVKKAIAASRSRTAMPTFSSLMGTHCTLPSQARVFRHVTRRGLVSDRWTRTSRSETSRRTSLAASCMVARGRGSRSRSPAGGSTSPCSRPTEGADMASYVQTGPVTTWYEEHGDGEPPVLLHGGPVDARFFEPNLKPLAERFHVYTPERRGHGHTADVEGPITYQLMTDDTIAFLDQVIGGPSDLVGHSDGAFIAIQRPDLVNRLVMISGGFDKSGEAAPDMEFDVDQVVQFLGTAYGEVSPDGEAHFPVVAAKIGELMKSEPHEDIAELGKIR